MYGIEPTFWINLILLIAIVLILLLAFNTIMKKWLKVEKKEFFSFNHVNGKHKKMDRTIRFSTIIVILLGYVFNINREYKDWIWFLQPWFIIVIFIFVSETVRAVMEYKYAENSNVYILTISQIIFIIILFLVLFKTNFFGLI